MGQAGFNLSTHETHMDIHKQIEREQREIEQQGVAADLAEFEKQRQYPYQQLQFQQAMLQGLPLSAVNYTYQEDSPFAQTLKGTGGLQTLYDLLFKG